MYIYFVESVLSQFVYFLFYFVVSPLVSHCHILLPAHLCSQVLFMSTYACCWVHTMCWVVGWIDALTLKYLVHVQKIYFNFITLRNMVSHLHVLACLISLTEETAAVSMKEGFLPYSTIDGNQPTIILNSKIWIICPSAGLRDLPVCGKSTSVFVQTGSKTNFHPEME